MARDQFFADIRRSVAFMAPRVESDSPFTDPVYIETMLRGADLWLTPKTVEEFRPEDFADVEAATRDELTREVERFRHVAGSVDSHRPARSELRDAASPAFTRIVRIVQDQVRKEWLSAATRLLAEAESWARERDWPTKRYPKHISEDFIGQYQLDRLVYAAEGVQLALIPVGRYVPGTAGSFDLAVLPAFDSVMVSRVRGRWIVDHLEAQAERDVWSQAVFAERSLELARLP